jgi:hypothetical protein
VIRDAIVLISRHEKLTTLSYSIFWCLEFSRKMSESICEYLPTTWRNEAFGQENYTETSDGMPKNFQAHGLTAGMLDHMEHNHNNVNACPNGPIIEFLVELAMSNIFARACDVLSRENLLLELWM